MNTIDLQIQTTASDGTHAPIEIVAMAHELQLETIAITDHDSVEGVAPALAAAEGGKTRVIPGIEMSVEEHGVHILGYGLDHKNPELLSALARFKQGRMEGAQKMVENLQRAGFVVDWEDVMRFATGDVIARPHMVRAVLSRPENKEKLGGISTVYDFIQKYLTDESPLYVKRPHIGAEGAIKLIRDAGGVPVWSHPAVHFHDGHKGLEEFLKILISWGLEGIEVFNPSHSREDAVYLKELVARYNLFETAGSDFHEKGTSPRVGDEKKSAAHLGDFPTYGFSLDAIVPRLDEAMAHARAAR